MCNNSRLLINFTAYILVTLNEHVDNNVFAEIIIKFFPKKSGVFNKISLVILNKKTLSRSLERVFCDPAGIIF